MRFGRRGACAIALLSSAAGLPVLEGQDKAGAAQPASAQTPSPTSKTEDDWARSVAASQPGPEYQWLQPLIGSWKAEMTWHTGSGAPLRMIGTSENRWILGGRFILAEASGSAGTAAVEDKTIYGYDRWERKFFSLGLRNVGGSYNQDWGPYDPVGRTFVLNGKERDLSTGTLAVHRQLIKILSPDRYSIQVFIDVGRRRPRKVLDANFTRR